MAVIDWPTSLPAIPSADGYSETPADTSIRTPMEVGPDKVRRRTTYGADQFQLVFRMLTSAQVDTLISFYQVSLLSGALEFNWEHPRTQVAEVWRMVGPPVITPIGTVRFQAACQFERLP